jgi:hypothetical protein
METFRLKTSYIIVPGAWNTRIFDPMWLMKNFDLDKQPNFNKKIGISFNFEERDVKFDFCGISVIPTNNNLTLQINDFNQFEDKCNFTETILKKIFLLLPQTPIKGIGFDFVFEFLSSTTSSFAKNILNKSNLNGEFTLSRNYYQKKEKDYILTIIGSINNDDPDILGIIEFNYNYKSPNYLKGDNVFCNQYNISTRLING